MELRDVEKSVEMVKAKDSISLEDALRIMVAVTADLKPGDLKITDAKEAAGYVRKTVAALKILVKNHQEDLVIQPQFTTLQKNMTFLEEWEADNEEKAEPVQEEPFDIEGVLAEKETEEEKFFTCLSLEKRLQEHDAVLTAKREAFEQAERMKQENHEAYIREKEADLLTRKKALVLELLRTE